MIISRYLTREIVNALSVVMIVLLFAFLSQQVVRYLNYVAIGKIPTNILINLVSFEIPFLVALLLPLALYLGILLAFSRLYADNEMIIMQMSGFGNRQVLRLTLTIALAASAIVFFLMLYVNPWISQQRQQLMSSDQATLHLIQTLIPGRFQASPDGRHVMYVEKLSRDHQRAETVFLAKEKKPDVEGGKKDWMIILADQGYQIKDPTSQLPYFVTTDGFRYEGTPGKNDYKITQFKKYAVHLPPPDLHNVHQESETLTTTQLWHSYQNPKHAAELQWRLSIGIATFLLAMLAVPFSALRPRQTRYLILLPAILTYIAYIELLAIARRFVEQTSLSTTLGMWWVHVLMLLFILIIIGMRTRFLKVKQRVISS